MEHLTSSIARQFGVQAGPLQESLGERTATCPTHGPYVTTGIQINLRQRRQIWTKCQKCLDDQSAKALCEADQEAARRNLTKLESQLSESAIPLRFIGRSLDNFQADTPEQSKALAVSRNYVDNFNVNLSRGTGLVFAGLPGTGKSHLATAILQAIMPTHCGLYITCMGLIRAVRGTWRKDSDRSEAQVLSMLGSVPLLVLDEIGVQYGTDGEQTILFDVLDRRYRDMRPTILLTNQSKDNFKEFIGERSFDRLRENSRWVTFDWPSHRPKAREEARDVH